MPVKAIETAIGTANRRPVQQRQDLGYLAKRLPREQIRVYLYDDYPGGIGLSEPLYRLMPRLVGESRSLVARCPCRDS